MQRIENGYRTYTNYYDSALTSQGFWMKLYNAIAWGLEDRDYVRKVLTFIPPGFSGALLDVPAGTCVHTYGTYERLPDARITLLDYSADMLGKAKRRMEHCEHIAFAQGDVGALPFDAGSFDIVCSMNGFHAFPDKSKAFDETARVLKKGGLFCGCFYIRGERRLTDCMVRSLYVNKGWFTPPFFSLDELRNRLEILYREVLLDHVKSIAYFRCVK